MTRTQPAITPRPSVRELQQAFAQCLAAHLPFPCEVWRPPGYPVVCWLDRNHALNHARLFAFWKPRPAEPNQPLLLRISINCFWLFRSKALARRLMARIEDPWRRAAEPSWHYELTLCPEEALDFVPWIARLAEAHDRSEAAVLTEPPHPCHFVHGNILDCWYAVTEAAADILVRVPREERAAKAERQRQERPPKHKAS